MSTLHWMIDRLPGLWRWVRAPFWLLLGVALGYGVPYTAYLDHLISQRFAELRFDVPSRVYARPLQLAVGVPMNAEALQLELDAARYREADLPVSPGTYRKDGASWELVTRAFAHAQGREPERRLKIELANGRIAKLVDAERNTPIESAWLDPARIATFYGAIQEERRLVKLEEVPKILSFTLQAVEDRDFKFHVGINPWAMLRAAWVDLVHGEVVQGGSTLTQQLVRNLFLDRGQRVSRKLNEILISLIIEARFDKRSILEAYLNEVYLGQQGAQAVHGVAAGCEFYFGHELSTLNIQETALLVGMIQGPSLYDPRRFAERAKARRDVVLSVMEETGIINATDKAAAQRAGLGITATGAIARNRYPAFLELVRDQLAQDYPEAKLDAEGLTIITTLAPSTQAFVERAVIEKTKQLTKPKKAQLESAVVVTRAKDGAIEAMAGGRDTTGSGFNRALHATRPIGSLIKPFVYLVALAQPERWSLMSPIEDAAIEVPLQGGRVWNPGNVDDTEHGTVSLLEALSHSYNLATVRLGIELDVAKVRRVLETLIPGAQVNPHPSLLLGATDLSPYQVAQAYQYLAADGHPLPLRGLEAVLDSKGKAMKSYATAPAAGDLVAASRLVGFAMQETARSGTAHALAETPALAKLQVAGKTGTSNDQRDSWFAGYTGSHLAVVWVGSDDNKETGLYGATGALKVWTEIFAKLPSEPLKLDLNQDPRLVTVDPVGEHAVDTDCPGAKSVPFIRGYEPPRTGSCGEDTYAAYEGDGAGESGDSGEPAYAGAEMRAPSHEGGSRREGSRQPWFGKRFFNWLSGGRSRRHSRDEDQPRDREEEQDNDTQ